MPNEANFKIVEDQVVINGLPPNFVVRRADYPSKKLATLKSLSIASINIQSSKFYMESIRTADQKTDPHMFDAAILAAILKYGSVFKIDNNGKKLDPDVIFTTKVRILNRNIHDQFFEIDDPERDFLKCHKYFLALRDTFIAHDDRMIGHTDCFATFDEKFACDQVLALTQRSSVYSAIKPRLAQLPICIDAVFTWLAFEKERYCQLVADEINSLKQSARRRFPAPTFPSYKGLTDAEERKARKEKYWTIDWVTGKKQTRDMD